MSVVPWILSGEAKNIATTKAEFDSAGGHGGSTLLIYPLNVKEAFGSTDGNVSCDLRVGGEYFDHKDQSSNTIVEGGTITLLPGMAVVVRTLETVAFPKGLFGYIVPKVSLLQKGLSNTLSKVDPGYNGTLLITIFNLGKRTERLKYSQPFCSLVLHEVAAGAVLYEKGAKGIGIPRSRLLKKLAYLAEGYPVIATLILFALTPVWAKIISVALQYLKAWFSK